MTGDGKRGLRLVASVLLAGIATGCASYPITRAYVTPLRGQGPDKAGQDSADCYRIAQAALAPVQAAPGSRTIERVHGLGVRNSLDPREIIGGAMVGYVASIFASEMADMRRYPPDLRAYSACLTERGYDVSWPKGQEPESSPLSIRD